MEAFKIETSSIFGPSGPKASFEAKTSGRFQGDQKHARTFMRTLSKFGEVWRSPNGTLIRTHAHIHQSFGEGYVGDLSNVPNNKA